MSSKVRSFDGQSLVSLVIAEVSRGAGGSSGSTLLYHVSLWYLLIKRDLRTPQCLL